MQGIHEFIIQIEKPLKDEIDVGKTKMFIDPTFDQTKHSNRIGKVISTPLNLETNIKKGDEVLIVHTALLTQVFYGVESDSMNLLDKEKGLYRIENGMIIMYRRDKNHNWKCNDIHVMVSPIKASGEDYKIGNFVLPENHFDTDVECNTHGFLKQYGIVKHTNEAFEKQGVKEGDTVFFVDYGDYEFNLEGEILYCMDNRDILAKI